MSYNKSNNFIQAQMRLDATMETELDPEKRAELVARGLCQELSKTLLEDPRVRIQREYDVDRHQVVYRASLALYPEEFFE